MAFQNRQGRRFRQSCTDDTENCSMPEQFRPRGVTMRDRLKSRAGFDRVLMAVAATFLTVSATSAFAQTGSAGNSAAELAIDAAIPRPEPAHLPPPTVNDFNRAPAAPVSDAAKVTEKAAESNPSDVAAAPAPDASKSDTPKNDTAKVDPANIDAGKNIAPTTTT